MADLIIAQRWLLQLGKAVAVRASSDDADDFVETMAPMLAHRFPNEAFSFDALEYVAAQSKFLPTYGELVERLSAWKRSQNPYRIWGGKAEAELLAMIPPDHRIERDPEKRGAQNDEQRRHASELVRSVSEQLAVLGEAKRDAMQAQLPPRPPAQVLSRAQLVEAYRQAGVKGPQVVPEPTPLRAAASSIPTEVRRSPPIDAEPHDA